MKCSIIHYLEVHKRLALYELWSEIPRCILAILVLTTHKMLIHTNKEETG